MRYIGVTVFCDHYSDFTYVHLMTKMDAESTIKAKEAFECLASESETSSDTTTWTMDCLIRRPSNNLSKWLVKLYHSVE